MPIKFKSKFTVLSINVDILIEAKKLHLSEDSRNKLETLSQNILALQAIPVTQKITAPFIEKMGVDFKKLMDELIECFKPWIDADDKTWVKINKLAKDISRDCNALCAELIEVKDIPAAPPESRLLSLPAAETKNIPLKAEEKFSLIAEIQEKIKAIAETEFPRREDKGKILALIEKMFALHIPIRDHHAADTLTLELINKAHVDFLKVIEELGEYFKVWPAEWNSNPPTILCGRLYKIGSEIEAEYSQHQWLLEYNNFFYSKAYSYFKHCLNTGSLDSQREVHQRSYCSPPEPFNFAGPKISAVIASAIEALSEEKSEARFFPTPTANSPLYPFLKPAAKFRDEEKTHITREHDRGKQTVTLIGKRSNPAKPPNLVRDTKEWLKIIQNEKFPPAFLAQRQSLIITINEISRCLIGRSQPKYRIVEGKKTGEDPQVVVEKIKRFMALEDASGTLRPYRYYPGIASAAFIKFFFLDDDFSAKNVAINERGQAIAFDQDKCIAPLSVREHNLRYPTDIPDRIDKDFGCANLADFQTLPKIYFAHPLNWWPNDLIIFRGYSNWLAILPEFLNEKFFMAIKTFVQKDLIKELVDIHLPQPERNKFVKATLLSRYEFYLNSPQLQDYFKTHRAEILIVINYEMKQFLKDDKHYSHTDKTLGHKHHTQWEALCNSTLKYFEMLLTRWHLAPLSSGERAKIAICNESIYQETQRCLAPVTCFYETNKMTLKASDVRAKIAPAMKAGKNAFFPRAEVTIPITPETTRLALR